MGMRLIRASDVGFAQEVERVGAALVLLPFAMPFAGKLVAQRIAGSGAISGC